MTLSLQAIQRMFRHGLTRISKTFVTASAIQLKLLFARHFPARLNIHTQPTQELAARWKSILEIVLAAAWVLSPRCQVLVLKMFFITQLSCQEDLNMQIVAGSDAMDCAKMIGRTPDMLTFMGRCVV